MMAHKDCWLPSHIFSPNYPTMCRLCALLHERDSLIDLARQRAVDAERKLKAISDILEKP